nr:hypothetical protein [Candidatus Sigynarchaeota archaeon]
MQTTKERVKGIIDSLPDDADYDDILYEINFARSIERGLEQLDNGEGIPMEKFSAWLKQWEK